MFKLGLMNRKPDIRAVIFLAMFSLWILPTIQTLPPLTTNVPLTPVTTLTPFEKLGMGVSGLLGQGSTPVRVIVQTTTHDYNLILPFIELLGGTVTIQYQFIDALAVTIPANALLDLAASPLVLKIFEDTLRYLQEAPERGAPEEAVMGTDPELEAVPIDIEALEATPEAYVNPALAHADDIWFEPGVWFGAGTRVAIIDTGCWHTAWEDPDGGIHTPWYWGNVYGGVDLSYDVGNPTYEGYDNPMNHYHGTFVATQVAAHAEVIFGPGHLWAESMLYWWPDAGYVDNGLLTVSQLGSSYVVAPIEDAQDAVSFYDYFSASGHTPYMEDLVSKIYVYEDTNTGERSLIIHHSIDNSVSGNMLVDFYLDGVPTGAFVALSDDPSHTWNASRIGGFEFDITQTPAGNWYHGANSDGGVLSGLPFDEAWSITIDPNFIAGLTDWEYQEAGSTIPLDMTEPVTISWIPPRPHIFVFGIAPLADIFAVKVFDHTGGGIPSSMVMAGMEAAMLEGVDVMSMSLGGGVGAPGDDPSDLLADAATAMGITVVISAGNDGPAQIRIGSPGTARTAITVGAAIDPIHHRMRGGVIFGDPAMGWYYYPHDEKSIAYFSSRGPTADGRNKPDIVATGYHNFGQLTPAYYPYTIATAGGTSFSCPVISGAAALLIAYIRNNALALGPEDVKKALMCGADPIPGFSDFEQGAGYVNCLNSLNVIKGLIPCMDEDPCSTSTYHIGDWWIPPVDRLMLWKGKTTLHDITIDPGKYKYWAFKVDSEVDAIRITFSGVTLAEEQNPVFGDGFYLYVANAPRGGIDDYAASFFVNGDGVAFIEQMIWQPGLQRLAIEGDWPSFGPIHIEEMTIELIKVSLRKRTSCGVDWYGIWSRGVHPDGAMLGLFEGLKEEYKDSIYEGEDHYYMFTIPEEHPMGHALVQLSWKRDWSKWATSDLDMILWKHDGLDWQFYSAAGATGESPEWDNLWWPGTYLIQVNGYQVYFGRSEPYTLMVLYVVDVWSPLWMSPMYAVTTQMKYYQLPEGLHGVLLLYLYDAMFDHIYPGDFMIVEDNGLMP
jgi:subtilisin family serine protease